MGNIEYLIAELVVVSVAISAIPAGLIAFLDKSYDNYKRRDFSTLKSSMKYNWLIFSKLDIEDFFRLSEKDFDKKYAPVFQQYLKT